MANYGEVERDGALERERDELRAEVTALRAAVAYVPHEHAHWDSTGQHGAGCAACRRFWDWHDEHEEVIRRARDAAMQDAEEPGR